MMRRARPVKFFTRKKKMENTNNENNLDQDVRLNLDVPEETEGQGEVSVAENVDEPKQEEKGGSSSVACDKCSGSGLTEDGNNACENCGGTGVK